MFLRVDSVMLLEEGFEVQSADISDKMLKQAYKTRWDRRKEDLFDQWGRKNKKNSLVYDRFHCNNKNSELIRWHKFGMQ